MADHDTHDHTGVPGVGTSVADIVDIPTAEMDDSLVLSPDGAGGVEWATNSGAGDILDLPTTEMDDTLVLAPDGAGGVEFRAETGGGGGSDPYADYAFTTLSGWTQFGSPDTCSVSNFTDRLHLKKNANASVALAGVYQTQPSYPFTLDLYVDDATPVNTNYARVSGLFVAEASMAGKVLAVHANAQSSAYNHIEFASVQYTSITAFGSSPHSQGDVFLRPPMFYRIVAASTTDVSLYYSYGGKVWRLLAANYNPGFTIGAIGTFVDPEQAGYAVESVIGLYIH